MKITKLTLRFFGLCSLVLAGALFNTGCAYNKVRLQSGSLDFLKQQSVVNVAFSYDSVRVGRINHKSVAEQEYIDKKINNLDQKSPGSGQAWSQEWTGNRTLKFQPKFLQLLNKQFEGQKTALDFGMHPEAPYTMLLNTTYLEGGYNVGISARPALLSADVTFFETKNPAQTLAAISLVNLQGMDVMGYAYDAGWRMQESYAKAGKRLGALIRKKVR